MLRGRFHGAKLTTNGAPLDGDPLHAVTGIASDESGIGLFFADTVVAGPVKHPGSGGDRSARPLPLPLHRRNCPGSAARVAFRRCIGVL
jgi:hypothetical protein